MKTILWNQQVQTERTIPYKKPDIIIRGNEKGICVMCDRRCCVPGEGNVIKKEAREIFKV